jgi:putative colanic acid biosynthesis glycosyltransferase WcaE
VGTELQFSIITVHYNELESLVRTVNSVSTQTFRNFEHVVIDGDSGDGTKKFLAGAPRSQNFKYISKPDRGLYHAMNKGIDLATGKYLIFLNAGDSFSTSSTLSKVNDCLVGQGDVSLIYGATIERTQKDGDHFKRAKTPSSIWYGIPTRHQSMFFCANYLKDLKYIEWMKIAADQAFVYQFISQTPSDSYIVVDFSIAIFEQGGVSSRNELQTVRELWHIRRHVMRMSVPFSVVLTGYQSAVRLMIRYMPFIYNRLRFRSQ